MYQALANGGSYQNVFSGIIKHTISTAQSGQEPTRHKELHAVAVVFTQKTITVKGIRL
jgi:hypothetical protein